MKKLTTFLMLLFVTMSSMLSAQELYLENYPETEPFPHKIELNKIDPFKSEHYNGGIVVSHYFDEYEYYPMDGSSSEGTTQGFICTYNRSGRLKSKTDATVTHIDDSVVSLNNNLVYTFDGEKLMSVEDTMKETKLEIIYDENNKILQENSFTKDVNNVWVVYKTYTYTYNNEDQVTNAEIHNNSNQLIGQYDFIYDTQNNLTQIQYSDLILSDTYIISYTYDSQNRIDTKSITLNNYLTLQTLNYSYSANLIEITEEYQGYIDVIIDRYHSIFFDSINITAVENDGKPTINWNIDNESSNIKEYIVRRRVNNGVFIEIAAIPSLVTPTARVNTTSYNYTDTTVPSDAKTIEYSIEQIDNNETMTSSGETTVEKSLPVTLSSFNTTTVNNDAVISWSTSQEINNSHFNIQRSFDGQNFETIGEVDGHGNTSTEQEYSYTDYNVGQSYSTVYYRLQQVDFDGNSETFDAKAVTYENSNAFTIFPNPSIAGQIVTINGTNVESIEIYNTLGKKLHSINNDNTIDLTNYSTGVYFVVINGKYTQKLIVK